MTHTKGIRSSCYGMMMVRRAGKSASGTAQHLMDRLQAAMTPHFGKAGPSAQEGFCISQPQGSRANRLGKAECQ